MMVGGENERGELLSSTIYLDTKSYKWYSIKAKLSDPSKGASLFMVANWLFCLGGTSLCGFLKN